jgi:hypothetical protein
MSTVTDWINFAEDEFQLRAVVTAVMKLQVPQRAKNIYEYPNRFYSL